jgi:RNA polymerase sigma factor (sigma-70 family)
MVDSQPPVQDEVQMISAILAGDTELYHSSREVRSEALERRELREMLRQAIDNLSPIYREVVLMRDVEEFSIEETSAALTISISSVKVQLHRARIMLRKELCA